MIADSCRFGLAWAMLVVGLAIPGQSQVIADRPDAWGAVPRDGVLVLRNGHVLKGKITWADGYYHVALPNGRIYVRPEKVDFCCGSLEEAYWRKRSAIRVGSAEDHLQLARWCQRHGLLDFAAQGLVDAMGANPGHPMIPLLERRLKTSAELPRKTEPPARLLQRHPPVERLDHLVREMPPGAVERFTQTIQPLLLNHCSMAGCHGPRSETEFSLLRGRSRRALTRRVTQRNLRATLGWINQNDPPASPLLTEPIRSHGSTGPIFAGDRRAQYEQLFDWVEQVAPTREPSAPAAVEQRDAPAVQAASVVLPGASGGNDAVRAGPHLLDSGNPASSDVEIAVPQGNSRYDAEPTDRPSMPKPARLPLQFVPADPFDPEIFNRRFFPDPPRLRTNVPPATK